jgi:hypothetical protein
VSVSQAVAASGPFIEYATLLGGYRPDGQSFDKAFDVVVAPDGSAYVGGSVATTNFPGLSSATYSNGGLDLLYVAKLHPDRGHVDAIALVGARTAAVTTSGSYAYAGSDQVEAMAIGPAGNVYVAAYASSVTYPLTADTFVRAGAKALFRVAGDGAVQALPASIDPAVTTIRALAVDTAGAIYITGVADAGLVTTTGAAIAAASATTGGPYLIKFSPGGTSVAYATYLSISGSRSSITPDPNRSHVDEFTTGYALAVDAVGNAYVAGQATADDFPVRSGFPDTGDHQNRDAFVAKINAAGSALTWVARLGGLDAERATSVALAPDGSVVIGGKSATLPGQIYSAGNVAFQRDFDYHFYQVDRETGFIAKLAADGARWIFVAPIGSQGGTLVSGASTTEPSPIKVAVDAVGAIYATGHTFNDRVLPVATTNLNSPYYYALGAFGPIQSPGYYDDGSAYVTQGVDAAYAGNGAFLMKVKPDGTLLDYSVIVDIGATPTGLALDANGAAYVVGYRGGALTVSADQASTGNVFIAKVVTQSSPVLLTATPTSTSAGQKVTLSAVLGDARYAGSIQFRDGAQAIATAPLASGTATFATTFAPGIHRLNATFVGAGPFNGTSATEVILVVNQSVGAQ